MLVKCYQRQQPIKVFTHTLSFPQFAIRVLNLILVYYFESFSKLLHLYTFLYICIDIQPSDSLSQIAALDIGKLLPKAPEISERVLFNVWESLLKDWGPSQ